MQKDQAGAAAIVLEQQLLNAQSKWAAEAKARAASEKWLDAELRSKARGVALRARRSLSLSAFARPAPR